MKHINHIHWKTLSSILILVLIIFACSKTDRVDPVEKPAVTKEEPSAFFVSEQEAKSILAFSPARASDQTKRTSGEVEKRTIKKLITHKDESGNVLYYTACYDNNQGWTVLSADRRTAPVISYSESGEFNEKSDNPGRRIWFSRVKEEIVKAKETKEQSPEAAALWKEYDDKKNGRVQVDPSQCQIVYNTLPPDVEVAHLTSSVAFWHQGTGFNFFQPSRSCGDCGKAATSCGALAAAEVLRYHRTPITYNGFAFTNAVYEAMPIENSIDCNPGTDGQNAARLIKMCADGLSVDYNATDCQSWSLPGNTDNFFSNLGFTSFDLDLYTNRETIYSELLAHRPVIAFGTPGSLNFWDGHIWVIDGIRRNWYVITNGNCTVVNPNDPRLFNNRTATECCEKRSATYWQMNWGWSIGAENNEWIATSVNISSLDNTAYSSYAKAYIIRP